jgi:uncharacterized protein (TIGR03067 family)
MKNVKTHTLLFCATFVLASGCSTSTTPKSSTRPVASAPTPAPQPDSAALQGTWKGKEIGGQVEGNVFLIISGEGLEYRGADRGEWYKGMFTLREDTKPKQLIGEVRDCPEPSYIGKKCLAIYRIDGEKLTITGNEPGKPEVPSAFDAADSRRFVLQKQ